MKPVIQNYKNTKGEWTVTFSLYQDQVYIQTVSNLTMEHFEAIMTIERIKEDRNFEFFFTNLVELFKFLETSFGDLAITKEEIKIEVQVPLGKIKKQIQLKIPTVRKELDESSLRDIKMRKMQEEIDTVKQENQRMKRKLEEITQAQRRIEDVMKVFQRTLKQKDEVINSIFEELKELRQWKQQKESSFSSHSKKAFAADTSNPHNSKFIQMGNRYKKKSAVNAWDILMCKHQIQKNSVFKYSVRQIRAGLGGSFMYGIGTANLRGVIRAQDNKQYVGYYQNTGNVYDRGESRKGGSRIKDGDVIVIEVDTANWLITWTIEGVTQAQVSICAELRTKPLFLAFVVYNDEAEIQFI